MKSNLLIPLSIVIAGVFIAFALFFAGGVASPTGGGHNGGDSFGNNNSGSASSIRAVSDDDHVFGDPEAPVTIVEFSDFECPFCSRLHPTLERVVEEYDGKVKWVYRHFPLNSIHRNAEPAAIASECVASLGGNDAFWSFGKTLFNNQRSLGPSFYKSEAEKLGIDGDAFTSCLADNNIKSLVTEDLDEVTKAGGRGTPFSVLISSNGQLFPFSGALPYEQVKSLVDQALVN